MSKKLILLAGAAALLNGCSMSAGLPGINTGSSGRSAPTGARANSSAVVVMPDVTGLHYDAAVKKIRAAGITGKVHPLYQSGCEWKQKTPAHHVCYSHPPAGRRRSARLAVQLQLAKSRTGIQHGKRFMPMPNVIGMKPAAAKRLLEGKGMKHVTISSTWDKKCPVGIVCHQNPKPGAKSILVYRKQLFVRSAPKAKAEPTKKPTTSSAEKTDNPHADKPNTGAAKKKPESDSYF